MNESFHLKKLSSSRNLHFCFLENPDFKMIYDVNIGVTVHKRLQLHLFP